MKKSILRKPIRSNEFRLKSNFDREKNFNIEIQEKKTFQSPLVVNSRIQTNNNTGTCETIPCNDVVWKTQLLFTILN